MGMVALYVELQPHICNLTYKPRRIFYPITFMVLIINRL